MSQKASVKTLKGSSFEPVQSDCTLRQGDTLAKLVPDHKSLSSSLTTEVSDVVKKDKIEFFVEYKLGEK